MGTQPFLPSWSSSPLRRRLSCLFMVTWTDLGLRRRKGLTSLPTAVVANICLGFSRLTSYWLVTGWCCKIGSWIWVNVGWPYWSLADDNIGPEWPVLNWSWKFAWYPEFGGKGWDWWWATWWSWVKCPPWWLLKEAHGSPCWAVRCARSSSNGKHCFSSTYAV